MDVLEQLYDRRASILEAINKIENGAQEYRIGTRTVRRADLGTLYSEYRMLESELARQQRPCITRAVLPRRR